MGSLESDSGLGVEPVSECVRRNRHVLFCCTQAGNNDYSWMYVHNFSRYGTIIILKRGGHSIHTSSNKTYSQSGCFQDPLSHPTNKILPNILPLAPLPNSLKLPATVQCTPTYHNLLWVFLEEHKQSAIDTLLTPDRDIFILKSNFLPWRLHLT